MMPEAGLEPAQNQVPRDFPIKTIADPHEQEQEFRDKLQYNVPPLAA
jgi:hypothetical protein